MEEKTAKSANFNSETFSRQLYSMLGYEGDLEDQTINGFTKQQIANMVTAPEKYQSQLVDLSNYMYRSSGYYKGVANYYINMALYRWTIDTEALSTDFYKLNSEEIKQKYFEVVGIISKLNFQSEIAKIFKRVILEDCCYGYLVETEINTFIYYLPSNKCKIKKQEIFIFMETPELRKLLNEKFSDQDFFISKTMNF